MFDIGWGELVVIGIVALIAIGPKELPTVLRTLGQWMGKVRRMANEFQDQFQEALREAEFADLKKHAEDLSSSVSNLGKIDPIADVQRDVERAFEDKPAAPADTAPAPAALPEPAPQAPSLGIPPAEPPAAAGHDDAAPAAPPASKAGSAA